MEEKDKSPQVYLAIKRGGSKNMWELTPYTFVKDAIKDIDKGKASTHEWKILRELDFAMGKPNYKLEVT